MRPGWTLGLLLLGTAQGPAADGGVAVSDLGFGFHARAGIPNLVLRAGTRPEAVYVGRVDTWMPFQVTLENRGASLQGTLVLKEAYGSGVGVVYRQPLTLPERARKRLTFPALHQTGCPMALSLEDASGASVRIGGERRLEVPPPQSIGVTSAFVLVATEGRGNFAHFLRRGEQERLAQDRYIVSVTPRDLPENPIEYHGVDVLVLDDLPLDALSEEQQSAIRVFVARGGLLTVSLHRHATRAIGTSLEALLPGIPDGVRNVNEVAALRQGIGMECALDSPLAVTIFQPRGAAKVWGSSAPTVLHRACDRGWVVLCGFPFSSAFLETWPGAPRLMDLLADTPSRPAIPLAGASQPSELRREMAVALKASMVRTLPPFGTIVALMAGYGVLIVLLPYLVFRRLKRLEWSWPAVFVIALAGSGVIYAVGQRYSLNEATAFRVGLIEGGAEEGPRLRHNFWSVFSPRGERLDLSFEEASAVPFPLGRELSLRGAEGPIEPTIVSYDDARLRGLKTYAQDSSLFETTDRLVLPARLGCTLRRLGGSVTAALRWDPSFPLARAWVISGDGVAEFDRLGGGAASLALPGVPLGEAAQRLERDEDRLFRGVAIVLLRQASRESASRGRPVLLYQYDGAPSLKNRDIAERGLDFGWLELEPLSMTDAEVRWQIRRAPSSGRHNEAFFTDEGLEYTLVLQGPSAVGRIVNIRLLGLEGRSVVKEIYDLRAGGWRPFRGTIYSDEDVDRFFHLTPLGSAYARVRVKASGREARHFEDYDREGAYTFEAISRVERRAP